uniref:Bm12810 n=1 Tax=Brugia malayi TaxID=6279 RepID=A0A0I9R3F2_BRUMA|nr:Bm12810 [Brugia malayi]
MDSDVLHLKQTITDKLQRNGTLDRIQAELRCAVFLAIESTEDNEPEADESKLDQKLGYSIIYHFLRQNRFLATAAVFEKEIHQRIISLEELKKENAATFCFQFFEDSISLSNFNLTGITKQNIKETYSAGIENNETSNNDSNFILSFKQNNNKKDNIRVIERQQTANSESNRTMKSFLSNNEISTDTKGSSDKSSDLAIISEQQQQQQIPKTSSIVISKDQQQPTKYITSSSSYPRKLPPIKSTTNELAQSTRLPSIPSVNNSSNHTGEVPFSHLLDTILNSPSSNKSETEEDIMEEIIPDDLLQSDNNSSTTISF